MNPNEFNKYIKAYEERLKEQDTLNWLLGKYIAIGVNNPKKYPDKPVLREDEKQENRTMTATEMEEMMKRNTITLGGKIK